MEVVFIPLVGTPVLRALGAIGWRRFATWHASAAHALAVMLLMTAAAHFVPDSVTAMPSHDDMVAMVPPFVPWPSLAVYATGVLELLGAAGLVHPTTRRAAGLCLAALFAVMLPANVYAAVADIPLNGAPATPLWIRIPEQVLYIGIALWAAKAAPPPLRAGTAPRRVATSRTG